MNQTWIASKIHQGVEPYDGIGFMLNTVWQTSPSLGMVTPHS